MPTHASCSGTYYTRSRDPSGLEKKRTFPGTIGRGRNFKGQTRGDQLSLGGRGGGSVHGLGRLFTETNQMPGKRTRCLRVAALLTGGQRKERRRRQLWGFFSNKQSKLFLPFPSLPFPPPPLLSTLPRPPPLLLTYRNTYRNPTKPGDG